MNKHYKLFGAHSMFNMIGKFGICIGIELGEGGRRDDDGRRRKKHHQIMAINFNIYLHKTYPIIILILLILYFFFILFLVIESIVVIFDINTILPISPQKPNK